MGLMIHCGIILTPWNFPRVPCFHAPPSQLQPPLFYCLSVALLLIIRNHCIPCVGCSARCESSLAPPLGHLSSELRVESEVDDGIHTDRGLAEHGGDGQDVKGMSGLGCVASCFCYGYTGIRNPAENVGKHLNRGKFNSEYRFASGSPWRLP